MTTSETPKTYTSFDSFGDLLKYLRRRMQLTQRELAIAVGYSEGQINRLEKNQRTPDLTTLLALFIPALHLEHEVEVVTRLTELAAQSRQERVPNRDTFLQSSVNINNAADSMGIDTINGMAMPRQFNRFRLPQHLLMLIGREQEMIGITRALARSRLITLIGMGGVGKTRLAIEVGINVNDQFIDGVCLVELANVTEADRLPQAIATALNISEQPGRTVTESLEVHLAKAQILLILDNCEHLVEGCAGFVEHFLETTSHVRILATSREALRVSGEIVWRVLPLATPSPTNLPSLEQMETYAAISLFTKFAQLAQPAFRLSIENANHVAIICHRLDGLPLALEMAAAQLDVLTVEEIAVALDNRFLLLVSGKRTALPRQQTLRATLDWSYALLTNTAKRLLARLSIFSGGASLSAIEAVCDGDLSVLLQLVQKSLVATTQNEGQTRYFLLESIRAYAREELSALDENEVIHERHLAYFLALVEETFDLGGRHVDTWVKRVEADHDNIRSAFAYACRRADDGEMALRLAGGMRPFRHHRGFYTEGLAWLNLALTYAHQGIPRAKALLAKATLLTFMDDGEQGCYVLAEESLRCFQAAGDSLGSAWALEVLAGGSPLTMNEERLANAAQECVKLFTALDCPAGLSRALRSWSSIVLYNGNQAEAEILCEKALEIAQEIGDGSAVASAVLRLSLINPKRAVVVMAREIEQVREKGSIQHLARYLQFYGEFQLTIGAVEMAERALHESLRLWQQLDVNLAMTSGIAPTLQLLGWASQTSGDGNKAMLFHKQAIKICEDAKANFFVHVTRLAIATLAIKQGESVASIVNLRACLLYFQHEQDILAVVHVVCQIAAWAHIKGHFLSCATLAGAIEPYERHVKYTFHMGISGVLRLDFVNALAQMRSVIATPELSAAWLKGQTLSLTEIIDYSLSVSNS